MALVVFLRGVNVGGHRRFHPSALAKQMRKYGVVNIGAAGTFVVRNPGSEAHLRAELIRKLPFETEIMICHGRHFTRLASGDPFASVPPRPDLVRFVSILAKSRRLAPSIPISLPPSGEWLLRIVGCEGRFVFGVYRRQMKTIGYLGQLDKLFGVPATTRNWNTIISIARILRTAKTIRL